ncbi:hypothetical protein [Hyella patelloides]|nr:hypothetical protein [Hyella patelloides]
MYFHKSSQNDVGRFPKQLMIAVFATVLGIGTPLIDSACAQQSSSNIPTFSSTLTVAEAYAAIPHDRTEYQFQQSHMGRAEQNYFSVMFPLIDLAVVLRIESVQKLYYRQGAIDKQLRDYQRLIDYWEGVTPPESLQSYHAHMLQALKVQKAFFLDWEAGRFSGDYHQLPQQQKVRSSSHHLQAAYGILMRTFNSRK